MKVGVSGLIMVVVLAAVSAVVVACAVISLQRKSC